MLLISLTEISRINLPSAKVELKLEFARRAKRSQMIDDGPLSNFPISMLSGYNDILNIDLGVQHKFAKYSEGYHRLDSD